MAAGADARDRDTGGGWLAALFGLAPRTLCFPGAARLSEPVDVVVAGAGIAGMSAATVLAERGAAVRVVEAAPQVGGRLRGWRHRLADGSVQMLDHGFHGFFRQYFNLRRVLARVDPELSFLGTVEGYPVVSRRWPAEDFAALPATPPFNVLGLLARSPSLTWRDLRGLDREAATHLLTFDPATTYASFDDRDADTLLTGLGLPERARAMLFDVFARSFFDEPRRLSAAELLANFHFYFLANPLGLGMDAPRDDYATAIWEPITSYLAGLGAAVETNRPVHGVEPLDRGGWRVHVTDGPELRCDELILALDPPGLATVVANSPALRRSRPPSGPPLGEVPVGPPYAVARLWLDRDVAGDRPVFCGVTGEPTLDSVTLYHRWNPDAGRWARRSGGAVVELHAYACEPNVAATELAARMRGELARLWPETAAASVVDQVARVEARAPGFPVNAHAGRPAVFTGVPGLQLAGDGVRAPVPCALMERAATTGILAANNVLRRRGVAGQDLRSVAARGLLARRGAGRR